MAVRQARGRWVVEFMQRGIRVFRRLPPGCTKGAAQQLESRLRNQIFDAVDLGKLPDPILSKVIDEWLESTQDRKSATHTASHAKAVKREVGSSTLGGIHDCARAISNQDGRADPSKNGKPKRRLATATINRRLAVLKAVAKYAYQKGYARENLSGKIQLLPEDNKRHVYLTQAQVNALIKAIPTKDGKAFVAIAAFTGLRQGEVMALQKADVGPTGLIVRTSKTGEPRIVPYMGSKVHLKALPFTRHKRTLYAEFEDAAKALELPYKLRYHDLRHTTASMLINSGADLYTVGRILGHKSAQTTGRYAHLSVERQREALERAFPAPSHPRGKKKARK